MGLVSSAFTSVIGSFFGGGSGGSSSGSSGGGAGAYRGQGMQGLGKFLTGLGDAYMKQNTNEDRNIKRLTPTQTQALVQALDRARDEYLNSKYRKEDAIEDVRTGIDSIFWQYEKDFLPQVYSDRCQTGILRSTHEQLRINDAYANTVKQAGELQVRAIEAYAGIHLRHAEPVNAFFSVLVNSQQYEDFSQSIERKPDVSEFAEDAAIFSTVMLLLDKWMRVEYASSTAGGTIGGLVDSVVTDVTTGITDGLGSF